ncbi:rhodanese domain-containing protein CG4456-like isoform X1 [Macrobrachium nipponense]|uniref:Rhodanese 2-like protein n=2 Tax=Macrobrachium nipponense TaxID=159736 RepID=A0A3G1J7G6_MACNP|nr:rhodanese 2-like protein [Macrobrachium nipponense]
MSAKHKEITYDELSKSLPNVTVIDVRNRNEMEQCGQIPGSHCIPVTEIKLACSLDPDSFRARFGFPKPNFEDDVVVCCRTGVRSKTACDLLEAKGYKRHRLYSGSFSEWEEKGGNVVKPGQPYYFDSDDEEENQRDQRNQRKNSNMMIPGDQQFSDSDNEEDNCQNSS